MNSDNCMSVLIGCPYSPTQLPDGPCLVVDAESINLNEWLLRDTFGKQSNCINDRVVMVNQQVISEVDHEYVDWHVYSDNRFNGPWNISYFSNIYTNLRLNELKKIRGSTLCSLLSNQKILADPFSTYQLFIRQGDPLIILQSAKEWLVRCTSISLNGLLCSDTTLAESEAYLKLCGFRQSDLDPSVWHPYFEKSSFHLALIRYGLLALFNADAYREIRPEMKEGTDIELMNHWLSQPNYAEIAKEIYNYRQPVQISALSDDDPALQLILDIFPGNFYRQKRQDLSELSDRELIKHYWQFGRHEGIDLSASNIYDAIQESLRTDYHSRITSLNSRVRELEALISSSNSQISVLQELIIRSQNRSD